MTTDLERRVRLVRAWEFRQRHHAKGMWMRLRRVLADAQSAYVIPSVEAQKLLAEGYAAHPVGREPGWAPGSSHVLANVHESARGAREQRNSDRP
jgi:hypothetical protein